MSDVSALLIKDFESEVITKFQAEGGAVRPYCRMKVIAGNQVQFKIGGIAFTQERSLGTPLPNNNNARTPVIVTVRNFTASALTDIFLNNQVNHDDVQEDAMELTMALRRREDQLLIDALNATSGTGAVPSNISGSTSDMTVEAFIGAAAYLDKNNVTQDGRVAVIHANGKNALLKNTKASSRDYVEVLSLVKGQIDTFYGFKVVMVGDFQVDANSTAGGLPVSAGTRTSFFYHPSALGYAVNMNFTTRVDYESSMAAHRVTGFLSSNAVGLQGNGIVKVTTQES